MSMEELDNNNGNNDVRNEKLPGVEEPEVEDDAAGANMGNSRAAVRTSPINEVKKQNSNDAPLKQTVMEAMRNISSKKLLVRSHSLNSPLDKDFRFFDDKTKIGLPLPRKTQDKGRSIRLVTESEVGMLYEEEIPTKLHKRIRKNVRGMGSSCNIKKCLNRAKSSYSRRCCMKYMKKHIPILDWAPRYNFRRDATSDIATGLTLGIIIIPQALSYGVLAGLPAYYGLYASLVAPCTYALLGTSVEASLGPYALISILVYDTVGSVVPPDENSQAYIDAVMTASILSGIFLTCLGIIRAGFIVNFLSDPVLQGLTTGGAFLIATSQMKHLLGLDIGNESFFQTWKSIFTNIKGINVATFLLGLLVFFLLWVIDFVNGKVELFKRFNIPGPLFCLLITTLTVYLTRLDEKYDVRVLGYIPEGLPQPRVPNAFHLTSELIVPAMIIAIVGYSLTMATTKTIAEKKKETPLVALDANQELLALGISSGIGGFFLGYPAFASLSRTTLAHAVGARSQFYTFVSVFMVLIVLVALTKMLYYLPYTCLSAIIIYALRSLFIQIKQLPALFRADGLDCIVWIATFFSVLALGIALGLGIGVGVSMIVLVYNISYPKAAILGRFPTLPWLFKDVDRYSDAKEVPGIIVYRFDAALNFANKEWFRNNLRNAIASRADLMCVLLHSVVVDASSMTRIDSSGLKLLKKVQQELAKDDIELIMCNCRGALRDALNRYDLTLPRYLSIADGVRYAEGKKLHNTEDDTETVAIV